jgi:hypothetical protein
LTKANGGTIEVSDHFGTKKSPWAWEKSSFTVNTWGDKACADVHEIERKLFLSVLVCICVCVHSP